MRAYVKAGSAFHRLLLCCAVWISLDLKPVLLHVAQGTRSVYAEYLAPIRTYGSIILVPVAGSMVRWCVSCDTLYEYIEYPGMHEYSSTRVRDVLIASKFPVRAAYGPNSTSRMI